MEEGYEGRLRRKEGRKEGRKAGYGGILCRRAMKDGYEGRKVIQEGYQGRLPRKIMKEDYEGRL